MRHHGHELRAFKRGSVVTVALAAAALLAGACTSGPAQRSAGPTAPVHPGGTGTDAPSGARTSDAAGSALALQVMAAPYQLPVALSREIVLTVGNGLLIVGGLTRGDVTTGALAQLNPVTGETRVIGHLATPSHDAAGAMLAGRPYVFGGGVSASTPMVQAVGPAARSVVVGQLPTARSDVVGVTAGTVAYLIGGYDGTTPDPAVLATTDGRHFKVAARLPVPVRYAAAATGPGGIWVFGGQTASGPTDVIQRINLANGTAVVAGHLPRPLQGAATISLNGQIYVAGGATTGAVSQAIYRFDPATSRLMPAGVLPVPVAYAAGAVAGGVAYLIGGEDGGRPVPAVTTLRLVAPNAILPSPTAAPWLAPTRSGGHLRPGSDPGVLPGDILIADHRNNRLLIVDPQGRIRWEFPGPGDLAHGQTFLVPDDAFFSPDGRYIVATQEDDAVISVISVATKKITYRYGTPGVPGSGSNHLSNPDDAMLTPRGVMIAADIKNCRIVLITPPAHTLTRAIGTVTQGCGHAPPRQFGSPNGAFPLTNGHYLVTEINGAWVDEMSLGGAVRWSTNPPGVAYPSDTVEVYPGRYLTSDYSGAGQVVEFNSSGKLLWRFGGLNHPSLAIPLPNGDILFNDDFNHRVCVVDPATNRIVWQYGHTGVAGRGPGYLNDPDGVDLVPPNSLTETHAATMGEP
jgi:outer membrane protein assembly factor BamB